MVADNSGAKKALIIGITGARKVASLGSIVTVTIKDTRPNAKVLWLSEKVKIGEIHRGVVVRVRKEVQRLDGRAIRFDDNAIVLLQPDLKPIGTRVIGPVGAELRNDKFMKIVSLAEKVL